MRFLKLGIILPLAFFATQVNAQDEAGKAGGYVGGALGLTIQSDSDVSPEGGGNSVVLETGPGFGLAFSGGYAFGNGARAEVEIGYRRTVADKVDGADIDGPVSSFTIMTNAAYDFNAGNVVPYIGAGIGVAIVAADINAGTTQVVNDGRAGFAYQAMFGVGYKVTPQVTMSFDYRLLGTTDIPLTLENGVDVEISYLTHSFMLGTRYNF